MRISSFIHSSPLSKPQKKGLLLAFFCVAAMLVFLGFWLFVAFFNFRTFYLEGLKIFGFPGSNRNYLVLFQDNYELRATGGFIPFYGVLKFRHGIFTGFDVKSSFGKISEYSRDDGPYAFVELLGNSKYTFRDANFDPDFPKTAARLTEFFQQTFPETPLSGVVAVDFSTLERLLTSVDSVKVNGTRVTTNNFFEWISKELFLEKKGGEQTIGGRFAKSLLRKTALYVWNYQKIAALFEEQLNEKHILIALKNKKLAEKVTRRGWDGSLIFPEKTDFLAWNVANLGGLKADRYISRKASYTISVEQKDDHTWSATAAFELVINHLGEENPPLNVPYQGVVKTYIPFESEIIKKDADIEETYKTSHAFSKIIRLTPGQSATIRYRYRLSDAVINNGQYQLFVPKQPGTADAISVMIKAPKEFTIKSADFDVREHIALFEGTLAQNRNFSLQFSKNLTPPLLTTKYLDGKDAVVLYFNRDIASEAATDGLNFVIRDLNVAVPQVTDQVFVKTVGYGGNRLTLQLEGMNEQPNEQYEIIVSNLTDKNGTYIEPDPLRFVVVQDYDSGIGGPEE